MAAHNELESYVSDLRTFFVRENHELRLRIQKLEKRPSVKELISQVEASSREVTGWGLSDEAKGLAEALMELEDKG